MRVLRFLLPLAGVGALLAASACQRGPAVPDLASYGALEPAVAALVTDDLRALDEAPSDANRWGVLAMSLDANGLTPRAEEAYRIAATLPASHGRWWYHVARLRARAGDADAALAALEQAIAKSPDYAPARWRKGQWLFDRGDLAGAEAAFRVAANLAADDVTAATGLARVQIASGRPAEAVTTLEALIARVPADRYAYHVLASAYRALGRAADAEDAGAAGAAGAPEEIDPWLDEMGTYRRGFAARLKDATALGMAGRYDEAIAVLERLRDERPDDRELRTYLGGLYATAGRTAQAKPLLTALLAEQPQNFDATMNLATAHLFDGAHDDADRLVTAALALRPDDADATRLRGVVAWRRQRLDDAERWLLAAAAANPRDAKALGWVGTIRLERARAPQALEAFRAALTRDPLLVDALVGGASAALATGATDEARRWTARAKQLAPGHRGLGDLERRLTAKGAQ